MSISNGIKRLADARTMAWYTAGALDNLTGGQWDKFQYDGKGSNDSTFPTDKPKDFAIANLTQQQYLFDRKAEGKDYAAALKDGKPVSIMVIAKQQSDMLASMLQAVGQRYGTRLRHVAATLSRQSSIAHVDADSIAQRMNIA